jgi:hypothetical protein
VLGHRALRQSPIDLEVPWCVLLVFIPDTFNVFVSNSDYTVSNHKLENKGKAIPVRGRGGP